MNDPISLQEEVEEENFDIEKWEGSGVPAILKAVRSAAEISKKEQEKNADKYNEVNRKRLQGKQWQKTYLCC